MLPVSAHKIERILKSRSSFFVWFIIGALIQALILSFVGGLYELGHKWRHGSVLEGQAVSIIWLRNPSDKDMWVRLMQSERIRRYVCSAADQGVPLEVWTIKPRSSE